MTTRDAREIPIANPEDCDHNERYSRMTLFQFQFGAYADTKVYVWADSFESAEEIAIEWADDNARGVFVTLTEKDLREAAEDLGIEWDEAWSDGGAIGRKEFGATWNPFDDRDYEKIVQHAEADLIPIGWMTLKSGSHVLSYEVHAHEVTDADEIEEVAKRSCEDEEEEEEIVKEANRPRFARSSTGTRTVELYNFSGPYGRLRHGGYLVRVVGGGHTHFIKFGFHKDMAHAFARGEIPEPSKEEQRRLELPPETPRRGPRRHR